MPHGVARVGGVENVGEIIGSGREVTRVDEFLEQWWLVADTAELDDDNRVVMMTLHAAKGLEFPYVFLIGMEEGIFPHVRAQSDPDELEEERRLFYVAVTRAKEELTLVHAMTRFDYNAGTVINRPSVFVAELPSSAYDDVEVEENNDEEETIYLD